MGEKKITHTHTHACSHCPVSQTSLMPQRPAGLTGEGERTATPISRNTKRWRMRLIFQGFPLFLLSRRCWDFGGLSSCTGRVWSVTRKLCRAHGRKALPWGGSRCFPDLQLHKPTQAHHRHSRESLNQTVLTRRGLKRRSEYARRSSQTGTLQEDPLTTQSLPCPTDQHPDLKAECWPKTLLGEGCRPRVCLIHCSWISTPERKAPIFPLPRKRRIPETTGSVSLSG